MSLNVLVTVFFNTAFAAMYSLKNLCHGKSDLLTDFGEMYCGISYVPVADIHTIPPEN